MKIGKLNFCALILFFAFVSMQVSSAQQLEKTLLWKIEGEGIKTSYLFGTFHILPESDFEMLDKVSKAFNETEQLVMELNMDNPLIQMEMMKHMAMKDGMTLDKLIDSVDYKKLDAALKESVGVGVMMFNTFKPMLVGTFLILNYIEGDPASFEITLTAMAKEKEMEIDGLETVEDQMDIFDEIPYSDQAEGLMKMVLEKDKIAKLLEEMIATYKIEDLDALYELTLEDAANEKEIEMLLFKRNREWIPKMEKFSKKKSTFFGVGAGHLGGEEGLVILLRDAGYSVTPIF
jgi:uncharacterized protein YbaP (TraB family)